MASQAKDLEWLCATVGDALNENDPSASWDDVRSELDGLHKYQPNWDGEGADAPRPAVIASANKWLAELKTSGFPPPFSVYPHYSGEVFVEWMFGNRKTGVRVCAEICPKEPNVANVMVFWPDKPAEFGDIPI